MNVGTISGGTHAGWRKVRQQPEAWYCKRCYPATGYGVVNARYLARCKSCGSPRPN